ncbi:MAG: hypothetical protein ACE5GI_05475 [Candidatus Aminicenantales bacterium]
MKKALSMLFSFIFLFTFSSLIGLSQGLDLSGTWKGTTEIPDSQDVDEITLVLTKTTEGYKGTVSDSFGFAQNEEIEDVEFEDNNFSFSFTIFNGEDYMRVFMNLTIDSEDSLSGYWELEDGSSSSIELKKINQ